jgi:hypothetical protein
VGTPSDPRYVVITHPPPSERLGSLPTRTTSRSLDPLQHTGALPSSNRKLIEVQIL